jgi:hypothetical protein
MTVREKVELWWGWRAVNQSDSSKKFCILWRGWRETLCCGLGGKKEN